MKKLRDFMNFILPVIAIVMMFSYQIIYTMNFERPTDYLDQSPSDPTAQPTKSSKIEIPILPVTPNKQAADDIYVMILSAWDHFAQRQMIRDTWAKDTLNYKFILGGQYCSLSTLFRNESIFRFRNSKTDTDVKNMGCYLADRYDPEISPNTYQENLKTDFSIIKSDFGFADIKYEAKRNKEYEIQLVQEEMSLYDDIYVVEDLVETYHNLTAKVKKGLKFILDEKKARQESVGPDVVFPNLIMKIDDDAFVLLPELQENIYKTYATSESREFLYLGHNNPIVYQAHTNDENPRQTKWGDANYNGEPRYQIPTPTKEVADRCDLQINNRNHCSKKPTEPYAKNFPIYMNGNCGYMITEKIAKWIVENEESLINHTCEDLAMGAWLELGQVKGEMPTITYLENGYGDKVQGAEWFSQLFRYGRANYCMGLGIPYEKRAKFDELRSVVSIGHQIRTDEMSKCYSYYLCNSKNWVGAKCGYHDPESYLRQNK